jgi:hypothetical protein
LKARPVAVTSADFASRVGSSYGKLQATTIPAEKYRATGTVAVSTRRRFGVNTFAEQVNAAVAAHGQWKARLRDAISTGSSEFQVAVVSQDAQCVFGKWLYGEGKTSFPSAADREKVRTLHAEFHREAAKVLALAVSGKAKEASLALEPGSPFSKISGSLVSTLTHLRSAAA